MITLHVTTALISLVTGLAAEAKGTASHRRTGWVYAVAIITMSISGRFIYEVSGSFTFVHLISIQTIVLVSAGLVIPRFFRRRIPEWRVWHMRLMLFSYLTLVVTGTIQFFEYLPFASEIANVIVFVQVPAVVGWVLIERRRAWAGDAASRCLSGRGPRAGPASPPCSLLVISCQYHRT